MKIGIQKCIPVYLKNRESIHRKYTREAPKNRNLQLFVYQYTSNINNIIKIGIRHAPIRLNA